VGAEEFDDVGVEFAVPRLRAYEAVSAVVSDDHNFERGVQAARAVADTALAESGPEGLTQMVVELSLKVAEAVECLAVDRGVTAVDLVDVLFVD
jgi:hypothetical protein